MVLNSEIKDSTNKIDQPSGLDQVLLKGESEIKKLENVQGRLNVLVYRENGMQGHQKKKSN